MNPVHKLFIAMKNLIANECTYECLRGRLGRDRMVVGFTTTCAINAYHHKSCEFEPRSWRGVFDTTLCDKVCQLQVSGFYRVLRFPPPIKPIKLTATILLKYCGT